MAPLRGVRAAFRRASERDVWVADGRAHIPALGVDRPGSARFAQRLEERLAAVDGVRAAAVNGVIGRVVVDFDPDRVTPDELAHAVEEIQADEGIGASDDPTKSSHPSDLTALGVPAAALAADLTAVGLSLIGRALRVSPIPVAVPWLAATVETRLLGSLGAPVSKAATNLGATVARAATLGLAHGEVGLLTDAAFRLSLLTEARARRVAWAERGGQLSGSPDRVEPIARQPRPAPLPSGQPERYARAATVSALCAGCLTLALSRSPARSFGFLVASTPTADRFGREAFAAQLGRILARRGVVALEPAALRRLDLVDVTVLDASALLTGRYRIDDVRPLAGGIDPVELHLRAHQLVDPRRPELAAQSGEWAVERVTRRTREPPVARINARPFTGRSLTLRLTHRSAPVALVTLIPELDPLAGELVTSARTVGEVWLAGVQGDLRRRLSVDSAVPGGSGLPDAVRDLQRAGRVVALVSAAGNQALAAADCGVGVVGGGSVPWGAHLICSRGLSDACLVLDAVPAARDASRWIGRLTLLGSVAAAVFALAGPASGAGRRAMAATGGAALFSIAAGTWSAMRLTHRAELQPGDDTAWHILEASTALERLGTGPDGLTPQEASRRLAERNQVNGQPERPPGLARASLQELENPLTPTLSIAAGTSAITGAVVDAALIAAVLTANALIGGAQRVSADRALNRLIDASAVRVRLRRNGDLLPAKAQDLVPGDVIELDAGDTVPADCRLLTSAGLEIDESGLTGESLLVGKSPQPSLARAVADRHSMLHEGTSVAAGRGTAVVVATGPETELGRTTRAVTHGPRPGGVESRLRSLTQTTVPICIGAGAAVVGAGLLWRRPLYSSLSTGISLAVAAVPEGLPFVATVAQLGAAGRLSRRNALVRRPATIEALGRVDVLCFDKTGTLTEGRIRLRFVSDGRRNEPAESLSTRMRDILAAALRASPQPGAQQPLAHPTDRAVLEGAARCDLAPDDGLGGWHPVEELPFEPARGYHAVLGRCADGRRIAVKGAPEVVMPRCTLWQQGGHQVPYDEAAQREVADEVDRLARRGYRVLAVAERRAPRDARLTEPWLTELVFLGLLALADPVRGSAAQALRTLRTAGVDVAVITGDHPSTAEAIAAELGLLDGRGILTGPEMDDLDDLALTAALPDTVVFARTTPAHKVRIVELLRRAGRVVAVTGDGANDAAAIKMADVGIALGLHGTNAAKEAADVVITDDRIETITDAIVEGRALWASVRDALAVMLGGNLAEIAVTLTTGLFTRGGSALNARQLLLVNLLIDVLPAMAIAAQRPTKVSPQTLLHEGPDSSLGSMLNREIAVRALATTAATAAAWTMGRTTGTRAHAGTVALVALVTAQLGQTLVLGRRSPLVAAASLFSFAALAVAVQTPGLSHFFGCRPLGPTGWAFSLGPSAAATLGAALATRLLRPAPPLTQP